MEKPSTFTRYKNALPPRALPKMPLVPCIISLLENISMRLGRVGLHIRECDRRSLVVNLISWNRHSCLYTVSIVSRAHWELRHPLVVTYMRFEVRTVVDSFRGT